MSKDNDNIAGQTAMNYLGIARDYAERGDYDAAERNAKEAAQYFGIAKKVSGLEKLQGD